MNNLKKYMSGDKISLIIALFVMIILFSFFSPYFLTTDNIINILVAAALMGLVAIGETYLLISGLVDLSAGSVAAFSSVLIAVLLQKGMSVFLSILIVVAFGLIIGIINGLIVNKLEIEPFIATLATMTIVRGLAFILSKGKPIFISNEEFLFLGSGTILSIPIPVVILIAFFIIFGIILAKTRFGRNIYVIGGNKKAAFLAGLSPKKK